MKNILTILLTTLILFGCVKTQHIENHVGMCDPISHIHDNQEVINNNYLTHHPGDTITLVGLDDISRNVLYEAKQTLEKFYKYKVMVFENNIDLSKKEYYDYKNQIVDCDYFVRNNEFGKKIIFITTKSMRGDKTPSVRGYTTLNGNTIIVKYTQYMSTTLKHEVGHTLGLLHCDNISCVMAIYNDEYDSGNFCQSCKLKIKFN